MTTFSRTRSRFPAPSEATVASAAAPSARSGRAIPLRHNRWDRGRTWAGAMASIAVVMSLIATLGGCSDEVVCGDEIPPYISARVEQTAASRAGSTYVEVHCVSDPLPGQLVVSVTGRQLPEAVEAPDRPGLLTSLADTQVIWQPGINCVLEVTTGTGISSATEPVPEAVAVTAPDTVELDEDLTLSWTESGDADYYLVVGAVDGTADEQSIDIAVDQPSITFEAGEIATAGLFSGRVWAVAGPFPQSGSTGNIEGEGWGYLSVLYRNHTSEFEVTIEDTAAIGTRARDR